MNTNPQALRRFAWSLVLVYMASMLLVLGMLSTKVFGAALTPSNTYSTNYPYIYRRGTPTLLTAKGIGTSEVYVLEVDPTTGRLPVDATVNVDGASFSLSSVGPTGTAVPLDADMAGGTDGTNLRALKVDSNGELQIDVLTSALPSGAATSAKQDDQTSLLSSIDTSDASTATSAASLDTKLPSKGQTTMSGSVPVAIASNQTAIPVTDNSGSLTVDGTVAVSNWPSTVDTNTGAASSSTPRVVLATRHEAVATPLACQLSNGSAAVAYDSGASGSTVPRVVLATRHEAVATPLAAQLSNGSAALAYDSGASSSATLRTVLATRHEAAATPISVRLSNGSAFGTPSPAGRSYADSVRNVYSSTNVTTSAWVQLIASTAATINSLTIFDSCGQTLELGTGAAASESRVLIIPPGGFDGPVPLTIASGTRVAVRAISATCSTGELDITGLN